MENSHAAIIGMGAIGRGWAILFAKAGFQVRAFDRDPGAVGRSLDRIGKALEELAGNGLVEDADCVLASIEPVESVEAAVDGAFYIQENVPERIETKQLVLKLIDSLAAPDAIVSSSSSSLAPDDLYRDVGRPERCLVAHPFNPPHLMALVELLPNAHTSEAVLEAALALLRRLGQTPVVIRKAVAGYVANRLQVAVVNEAMYLVGEGVISPADLDLCMTEGLGRRWSFLGPFATMDLNADGGFAAYVRNFRHAYEELGRDLKVSLPWTEEAVAEVTSSLRRRFPAAQVQQHAQWRDRLLMQIAAHPIRPVTKDTLRTRTYQALKRALLSGEFAPGEAVVARVVAERMGVGLMPVRESIQRLATEGGLEILPNRTVRVPELNHAQLSDIMEIRFKVEVLAAEKAASKIEPAELEEIRRCARHVARLAEMPPSEALAANFDFHFKIYAAARSPTLYAIIEQLWLKVGPLLILRFRDPARGYIEPTLKLHERLVTALENRSSDEAGAAMADILSLSAQWYAASDLK